LKNEDSNWQAFVGYKVWIFTTDHLHGPENGFTGLKNFASMAFLL
jgi:hypothetical protein